MSDETAINKAIQTKAQWLGANWRLWAPWLASTVIASFGLVIAKSIAYGKGEGKLDTIAASVARIEATQKADKDEQQKFNAAMTQKLDLLAPLPTQVHDQGERMKRIEDNWDFATQQAGVNPRPGHRTQHH